MKYFKYLLLILIAVSKISSAQKIRLINSGDIIKKAVTLYDSSHYREALTGLNTISRSDTNYVWSLYERAINCEADSQYTQAIKYCREGLSLKEQREYEPEFYNTYGNTLNDSGDREKALQVFDTAIAKYPSYSLLYFNKGTVYMALKNFKDAETWFQKALLINPYMYSAHYQLGLAAIYQGKIIPSMMSFVGYLLVNPSGRYWQKSIGMLDQISKATDDVQTLKNKRIAPQEPSYAEIEEIVLSKIAIDKSYKSLISIDDPISKQIQAVFEKLEYKSNSSDFWMQYYVPYYKQVFSSGKFEPFIFHLFSNVNITAVQDYKKKNKKELEAFENNAGLYFNQLRATRELIYTKRDTITNKYLYEEGSLVGKGVLANNGKALTGHWDFYYSAGNKKSKGNYSATGTREGEWIYYRFAGQLKAKERLKAGKLEGKQEYYFENGNPSSVESYVNGKAEGLVTTYYYGGNIKSQAHYKLDKKDGEQREYYSNGSLESVNTYANDLLTGTATFYFKNGKVKSTTQYLNGKEDGPYKSYFDDGTPATQGQFVKDNAEGEWKYYFESGKLREKRNYIANNEEGLHQELFDNGQVSVSFSAKKGKINGEVTSYYKDGKPLSKQMYDNGLIKTISYLSRDGKVLSNASVSDKNINTIIYSTEGLKRSHSNYNEKGNLNGPDTTYYSSGKIYQVSKYKDGEQDGIVTKYYLNGKPKSVITMVGGKEDGYATNFYPNGNIQSEGWMKDGQIEGDWMYYNENQKLNVSTHYLGGDIDGYKESYNQDGKKTAEEKYHRGWLQNLTQFDTLGNVLLVDSFPRSSGKYTLIYANKKPMIEANYVNGDFEGTYKTYYFDGSLESSAFYKKGAMDSTYVSYFYGGSKYSEGRYVNGYRTGLWKYYEEDGKLSGTSNYKNDELNGEKTYYFKNGNVDYSAVYKDDDQDGPAQKFNPDGTLLYVVNFETGDAKSYSYLGADGKQVPAIAVPYTAGALKAYFPNGKLARECYYSDGVKNGPETLYYPNGQKRSVDTLSYGQYNGLATEYNPNGKLKSAYRYVNDNITGIGREFDENGNLKKEIVYLNGENHGPAKYYNESGKLVKTMWYYYGKLLSVKNE